MISFVTILLSCTIERVESFDGTGDKRRTQNTFFFSYNVWLSSFGQQNEN